MEVLTVLANLDLTGLNEALSNLFHVSFNLPALNGIFQAIADIVAQFSL